MCVAVLFICHIINLLTSISTLLLIFIVHIQLTTYNSPSLVCTKLIYCVFFSVVGDLFVLVFSMDSRESFEEVIRLREQILETKLSARASGGRSKKNLPKVPMVIAGNKCDREMK